MDALAQVCTAVASVVLIAVFPLEAFLIDRPWVQRFLAIEPHGLDHVHLWSFCIGARNALAGVGGLVGLWIVNRGDETVGTAVVVTVLAYMLLSSLAMGVADLLGHWLPRGGSVRGTIASSVLPAVALVTLAL
jgi:putative membrane protein